MASQKNSKLPKIKYRYNRKRALALLMDKNAVKDWTAAEADIKRTETFIDSIFDDFEGISHLDSIDFAFCIPTRASRFNEEYWKEVYDFLPGLEHIDIHRRFAILACLPPFRVESYGQPGEPSHGAVLFVPIFNDMLKDYRNKLWLRREIVKRINDATNFAHLRMGAQYIGLGATLPKLTDFGRKIKSKATTTTGHAGTVWLMQETFQQVLDKHFEGKSEGLNIGFIGAGSIGMSALEDIGQIHSKAQYWVYDIRPSMNKSAKDRMTQKGINLEISQSNQELIKRCDIILSAITTRIDISGIDLSGKVIIDDSQPGQFLREQVEQAGGVLVWVVGHDASNGEFATRRSGYSYGPNGLNSAKDLWGCEAEVAAIAATGRPELAISDNVTPEQVRAIGNLFSELGIEVAKFQSFGRINDK